jgi:hypothetical protein
MSLELLLAYSEDNFDQERRRVSEREKNTVKSDSAHLKILSLQNSVGSCPSCDLSSNCFAPNFLYPHDLVHSGFFANINPHPQI